MGSSLNRVNLILKGCHQNVCELWLPLELDWESFYFRAYVAVSRIQFFVDQELEDTSYFAYQSEAVLNSLVGRSSKHGHLFPENQQGKTSLGKTGTPLLYHVCILK